MGDDDQGAGPAVEEVLEHVERLDVEVVGRLVEEQHVGLVEQQPQQLEASPLAAGQVPEAGGEPVAGEAEALQHRRGGDLAGALPAGAGHDLRDPLDPLDRGQHPLLRVDVVERLGEVLQRDGAPLPHAPDGGLDLAGDQPQHRRLAGTVDPDETDPVAGTESPGGVREQRPLAAHEVDVLEVDDVLAQALGGEALQLETVARRWFVLDQLGGGVDAELGLAGARRRPAAQPRQLLADQVLAARLRGGRLALPLGLGEHEGGVASVVHVDDAVVHLPGLLAHRVEEPAVVGDHEQRRRTTHQVAGQPGDRLHVEVVGRLVEHDQVVVAEQQPRQRAATSLTAGKPVDDPVEGDARPAAPRPSRGWRGPRPTRGRRGRRARRRAR